MRSKRVKAFGEVMMKLEVPDYMLLEQTCELKVTYSGTGVNVLSGLSQFGHHTSFISCLPKNNIGNAAVSHIKSLGIDTDEVIRKGEYIGSYILEKGFSIRPTNVTYSNRCESSFCTSTMIDYPVSSILKDTDMIHFCGIMLAVSSQTRELALAMARAAFEAGVTVVFDCNYRPKLWQQARVDAKAFYEEMLSYTDICFMTEKDAQYILGFSTNESTVAGKIEDLLPKVAHEFGISVIAGTIRNEGRDKEFLQGFLYRDSIFAYSQNYVYNTLERIGAGDGFASGVIHGIIHELSLSDTITFATVAGVLAHTISGDSPRSTLDDVWRVVKGNNVNIER